MKINSIPHLCWTIGVLLAIVAFLLLRVTNGGEINAYISFASSIASLILAVVAIFYSIISNDGISKNLSSLANLGNIVEHHTQSLDKAAKTFVEKVEEFTPHYVAIPEHMEAISSKISSELRSLATHDTTKSESFADSAKENGSLFGKKVTYGVALSAYLLSVSYKRQISISLNSLFSDNLQFASYVNGCLAMLDAVSFKGIQINIISDSFLVSDPGQLNIDRTIAKSQKRNDGFWSYVHDRLQKVYEVPKPDSSTDESNDSSSDEPKLL